MSMQNVNVMMADGGGGSGVELTRRPLIGFTEDEAMSGQYPWIFDKETYHEKFSDLNSIGLGLPDYIKQIQEIFDTVYDYGTSFNNKQEILDDLKTALDKMSYSKSRICLTAGHNIFDKITRYNDKLDEAKSTWYRNRINTYKANYNGQRNSCVITWGSMPFDFRREYRNNMNAYLVDMGFTYRNGREIPNCTCKRLADFESCESFDAMKQTCSQPLSVETRPDGT